MCSFVKSINVMAVVLLSLFVNLVTVHADEVTLYFWPSPIGFDWDSPHDLAISTVRNMLTKDNRKIGHAAVEVKCDSFLNAESINELKNNPYHFFSAMTDTTSEKYYRELLFKKKIGLGITFKQNFDGALEDETILIPDLEDRYKTGRITFVKYIISSDSCKRMSQYFQEYKENNYQKNYGLSNRPRYREGAGCTAFAASFLDVAGILNFEHFDAWTTTVRVPKKLIGATKEKKSVNFLYLLMPRSYMNWSNEVKPFRPLFFWNPDKMFHWVGKIWSDHKDEENTRTLDGYELVSRGHAKGLIKDVSQIEPPTDPIWKN